MSPGGGSLTSGRSAANLFGTVRMLQPGVLAPERAGRWASTSGGVVDSLPSQKGQSQPP
jgi:hypothetical protein